MSNVAVPLRRSSTTLHRLAVLLRLRWSIPVTTLLALATAPATAHAADGVIRGFVTDRDSGEPVVGAVVIVQCPCAKAPLEARTDSKGKFEFDHLPPGTYTVQVLHGETDVSKVFELGRGARMRADFSIEPTPMRRTVTVETPPIRKQVHAGQVRELPVGGDSSHDFTHVVDLAPTAARDSGGDSYAHVEENRIQSSSDKPLSTFSIDVDTASYSNARSFLSSGSLPPQDAVRVEEMLNYFDYDYPAPKGKSPFSVTTEVGDCPWNADAQIVHIGIQGRRIAKGNTPPRNLVFLLDVSGSMADPDKLPLLKRGLTMLVNDLRAEDRVAIVVYAGASGVVLDPTSGRHKTDILDALENLEAGGSTNGGAGIELAYVLARKHFKRKSINRVILATDGDFNVGTTSHAELTRLIERERKSGVFLSVLGFGTGNLQDATMEQLADRGNGNYAYIDSLHEARKVLVEQAGSTLVTIAKDVKLQVEFNPAEVREYRLVGYENRILADRDFNDDSKDAGEIGAGHSVTALYEIIPNKGRRNDVDPLVYQRSDKALTQRAKKGELLNLKIRYKTPKGSKSMLLTIPVSTKASTRPSDNFLFSAAVAEFALLLRNSEFSGASSFADAHRLAKVSLGRDPHGYRA